MITNMNIIKELVNLDIEVTIKSVFGKIVASLNTGAKSDLYIDLENEDTNKIVLVGRYEYINQDIHVYEHTTLDNVIESLVDIVLYECVSGSGFITKDWLRLAEGYDKVIPDEVKRFVAGY